MTQMVGFHWIEFLDLGFSTPAIADPGAMNSEWETEFSLSLFISNILKIYLFI